MTNAEKTDLEWQAEQAQAIHDNRDETVTGGGELYIGGVSFGKVRRVTFKGIPGIPPPFSPSR